MRPPLSYIPLLPVTIILVTAILIINPVGKDYPDIFHADSQKAIVESNLTNESGQHIVVAFNTREYGDIKARLTVPSTGTMLSIGDSVKFNGKLQKPHPRTSKANDNTFRLRTQGIIYRGFTPPDSISITGASHNLYWEIRRLRPLASDIFKRSSLSPQACEFLTATITGDTSILAEDTRRLYSSAGVAHILALSGLHVGILAIIISIVLFPLHLFRLRNLRLTFTIVALWAYAIFTGLSPSVTRAVIMATAISGGVMLQRRYFGFNGLLLAACVIIVCDPLQMYQPGFQMSFLAAASILAIAPAVNRISRKNKVLFYLASTASVSVAATIGTGIVSAYYFHSFPLYFLFANIPVLILLPFLMGAGVMLLVAGAAGADPSWLCAFIDLLYSAIHSFVSFISNLPNATVNHIYFPAWVAVPYFLTVASLISAIYLRKRIFRYICLSIATATCLCFTVSQPAHADEEMFLTYETYSTSCLYRHHDKAYLLTTAKPQNAKNLVENYMLTYSDYLGIHHIDSIIVAPDSAVFGSVTRMCSLTLIGDNRYLTVADNELPDPACEPRPTHAVICRGFRGDVIDIYSRYSPDSILLSNDLHPRRHNRYADSLALHDIPFRSLKEL